MNKFINVELSKSDKGKGVNQIVSDIWSQLDVDEKDVNKRMDLLYEAIDNEELLAYMDTEYYKDQFADIGKKSPLSEDVKISQSFEGMADYLLSQTKDDEYPILSKYAKERNAKSELFINDDDDFGKDAKNGVHEDVVGRFYNTETQQIVANYNLSEDKKRKLRRKNIRLSDFAKYPELLEMFEAAETLEKELGLNKDESDEHNEGKRNLYIEKHNDKLYIEKEKAFACWMQGKSRLSENQIERLKKNPMKKEEIMVNGVTAPITDINELESKFNQLLRYYGIANNGNSQMKKAKLLRNELGYETVVMKESLTKPIRVKGTNSLNVDTSLDQKELLDKFDFGDYKHIEGLLKIEQMTSTPVTGEDGKKIRHKYTIPLFQVLEDKHKGTNSIIENHLINEFRRLVSKASLENYESAIVNEIINGGLVQEKDDNREDIYGYIIELLHTYHGFDDLNKTKLKTLIRGIAKKVSHTYLDEMEIRGLGTLTCSKCKEDKVASERNFGKNKKNTGRNGLKSVCKECERKK